MGGWDGEGEGRNERKYQREMVRYDGGRRCDTVRDGMHESTTTTTTTAGNPAWWWCFTHFSFRVTPVDRLHSSVAPTRLFLEKMVRSAPAPTSTPSLVEAWTNVCIEADFDSGRWCFH